MEARHGAFAQRIAIAVLLAIFTRHSGLIHRPQAVA